MGDGLTREKAFLREALQDDFLFQNLDEQEQNQFIKAMKNEHITAGTKLCQQGDFSDFFCVVETGTIELPGISEKCMCIR